MLYDSVKSSLDICSLRAPQRNTFNPTKAEVNPQKENLKEKTDKKPQHLIAMQIPHEK